MIHKVFRCIDVSTSNIYLVLYALSDVFPSLSKQLTGIKSRGNSTKGKSKAAVLNVEVDTVAQVRLQHAGDIVMHG